MSRLEFAIEVIQKCKAQGIENLMNEKEAKVWKTNYNNTVNEGGYGYVPEVNTIEKYEWAVNTVKELDPTYFEEEQEEKEMTVQKEVMENAWRIAHEGQEKFGGKVSDYIAEAMRIAWGSFNNAEVIKEESQTEIVLAPGSRKHKTWFARINGPHAQYRLDREFLSSEREDDKVYNVGNGIYEAQEGGQRYFIEVTNGDYKIINDNWVYGNIA